MNDGNARWHKPDDPPVPAYPPISRVLRRLWNRQSHRRRYAEADSQYELVDGSEGPSQLHWADLVVVLRAENAVAAKGQSPGEPPDTDNPNLVHHAGADRDNQEGIAPKHELELPM